MAVLTEDGVAEALRELSGNMAAVGRKFGVGRNAVQEYVSNRERLKQICLEEKEVLCDDVEGAFIRNARDAGNVAAQIFFLKTQGRHRGYTERVELGGADGGPVQFNVVFETAKQVDQSDNLDQLVQLVDDGGPTPRQLTTTLDRDLDTFASTTPDADVLD